jgi:hypothetical protein
MQTLGKITITVTVLLVLILALDVVEQTLIEEPMESVASIRILGILRILLLIIVAALFVYITMFVFGDGSKGIKYKDIVKRLMSLDEVRKVWERYKRDDDIFSGLEMSDLTPPVASE